MQTELNSGCKLIRGELKTDLVPVPVEYSVLLPPAYKADNTLPLLLDLPGGDGARDFAEMVPGYEKVWSENAMPPMVVASFKAQSPATKLGCFYLNFVAGDENWEDFVFEFIDHINHTYHTGTGQVYTYMTGVSMGGIGTLRLGLKYPKRFGAIAAMEAGIDPVLNFEDLKPRNKLRWDSFPAEAQQRMWGHPVSNAHYQSINIPNVALTNKDAIKASGMQIFVEVGDRDLLNCQDGGEFLHRLLWDNCIEHEYRLIRGADHLGPSLLWRKEEACRWLGRMSERLRSADCDTNNPELTRFPELTSEQKAYYQWTSTGSAGVPPVDIEPFAVGPESFMGMVLARETLPDGPMKDHVNKPFGGPFRNCSE